MNINCKIKLRRVYFVDLGKLYDLMFRAKFIVENELNWIVLVSNILFLYYYFLFSHYYCINLVNSLRRFFVL